MKRPYLILILSLLSNLVVCQDRIFTNVYNRPATSLNGSWQYIVDPYENGYYNYRYEAFDQQANPWSGAFFLNSKPKDKSDLIEYDFDKMDNLTVPGDWNSQKTNLEYYEGTIWYKKSFDFELSNQENRTFLYFGASNYKTEVYLNGKKLGAHIGGFTPFQFEVTEHIKSKENHLIIKVDNKRLREGVPTLNTDWWNYGGLTRDIKIFQTSKNVIANYNIQLSKKEPTIIKGKVELSGQQISNKTVLLQIPELKVAMKLKSSEEGICEFAIEVKDIEYWSPSTPKLYQVILEIEEDKIKDDIGFRTIKTEGPEILLNEKSIFLKGISIHEESPINGGRGNSLEDAQKLLEHAKALGCNFVRLAHYPHNEHMIRLADKMGFLVWEEIPVYWTISWDNEDTYQNAQNQIAEVIERDINRASVIIWSMANETPTSESRNRFLNRLFTFTRNKDKSRLISAALEQKDYMENPLVRTISDPFADVVDILSFNQYIGWYDGNIEKCQKIKWHISQNKPVIISEFGAGAKFGHHGSKDERWTEEYQEYLYQETLKMLDQIEQLRGISPWILMDFKSPRRILPEIQDNYNRKGVISDKGEKKKAFYVLKSYFEAK